MEILIHPLSPNSDQQVISPNYITPWPHVQVMRMNWLPKMNNRCLNKFSQVVPYWEIWGEQWGEYACWYQGLESTLKTAISARQQLSETCHATTLGQQPQVDKRTSYITWGMVNFIYIFIPGQNLSFFQIF